ncbi:MAG TPA: hypothetical protein VLK58_28400 [Conexibacter sp.]|nr:hypothetical protein [Conexibacter sp.]
MSIRDVLRSAATRVVEGPRVPDEETLPVCENVFESIYGKADPATLRQATVVKVLHGDDADRHMGRELTDAQRSGLAAQISLEEQRRGA